MQTFEPIPTPWRHRWRELRVRAVPLVVFVFTGVIVAQLWTGRLSRANFQGIVVSAHAEVGSPEGGVVSGLVVEPFDEVRAGTVLGQVVTTAPDVLAARLNVVLAELEMVRQGLGPVDNLRRDHLDRSTLEMKLMNDRIALASARIEQQRIERDYERIAALHADNVATEAEYDRARTERDQLALEIAEREELIESIRTELERMDVRQGSGDGEAPLRSAMRLQEERLKLIEAELTPIELRAPIDGRVGQVLRLNGEAVASGEPIVVVRATRPDYIIGYLPHPLRLTPAPGMRVTVRSRAVDQTEVEGQILEVGAQFEEMEPLQGRLGEFLQRGLPVKVSLPPESTLRPGEIVEMTLFEGGARTEDRGLD